MTSAAPRLYRLVSCIAWLVPRERRAAWREEWLAELEGTARGERPATSDVLHGMVRDAFLLRVGAPDEWARDARAGVQVLLQHPAATVASVWVLGLWLGLSALLVALSHTMLAGRGAASLTFDRTLLVAVAAVVLAALSASALRATSALLAGLPRAENLRQRLAVVVCVGGGGLTAGVWLSRLALARVVGLLVEPSATP